MTPLRSGDGVESSFGSNGPIGIGLPRDTACIQGTASIRDDGVYPFRVIVREGLGVSADHLLLEVCGCNDATETGPIIYRASGYVGGQIHIQRQRDIEKAESLILDGHGTVHDEWHVEA